MKRTKAMEVKDITENHGINDLYMSTENKHSKGWISRPVRNCLILSLSFTFVYTAYLALQNLQSSLNQAAHLGTTSLSVLYGTIILFGTQAPVLIQLIGAKRVLVLAWVIHCIYTASNFYPTWWTLVPSSALLGAIAGPMWTAQGIYITEAGEKYAALREMTSGSGLHSILSRFNGIFFMFYEMTQITGNLISSLVLSASSHNSTLSDGTKICGPNDCPDLGNGTVQITEPERHVVYTLLGIFLACNVSGLLLTLICLPPHSEPRSNTASVCQEMVSCFKMTLDLRMLFLMPLFMGQAMAVGVLYADYTKSYISCALGIEWVGYIMTSYGICTAIFAVSLNWLAPVFGRLALFTAAVIIDTGTLIAMLLWQPTSENAAVFFLVPAFSGISEGIMQAQFYTLVAQVFRDDRSPAFATYHTSKAMSFTITFAMSSFLCLRERLYVSIGLYVLGLVGYIIIEMRLKRAEGHDLDQIAGKRGSNLSVLDSSRLDANVG